MSFLQTLDYHHWLLLGLLLLVIEVLAGGGFLMWLGFSALSTGLVVFILPWFNWELQLVIFAIGCILSVFIWWRFFRWTVDSKNSSLNRRGSDLVGREAVLKEPIVNGFGYVMIDGVRWQVTSPKDLPEGTRVRLLKQDDLIFTVEKIDL
ncbi:NfeD family protein [Candidatus Nitrosacidococcus sp. I8]|uniref:NfeD family protein n=1 Tax=Candidatus Nitrosacidococcus sp. I8 TaxID=2942908 RepID=UPI002227BEBE|nr:NfeD family protein [Candidatus Nitrosacidococcus sp. I8]CAH9018967.1 Inner membrane protein YbbJ [Candidatus Nitrosacidococcus sp. I8]